MMVSRKIPDSNGKCFAALTARIYAPLVRVCDIIAESPFTKCIPAFAAALERGEFPALTVLQVYFSIDDDGLAEDHGWLLCVRRHRKESLQMVCKQRGVSLASFDFNYQ